MLSSWWFSLCEPYELRLVYCAELLVLDGPGFLNPSLYSSKRLPELYPLFACGCLYFHQLLNEASRKIIMLDFCLQAQQSIVNSVKGWLFPMGQVSSWVSHWQDPALGGWLHFSRLVFINQVKQIHASRDWVQCPFYNLELHVNWELGNSLLILFCTSPF